MPREPGKPEAWETNAHGPFLTIDSQQGAVTVHSLGGDRFLVSAPDHEQEVVGFEAARSTARQLTLIDAELIRAGRTYIDSRGANRDELQRLVYEATKGGMALGAIASLTKLQLEDIEALNRELEQDGGA
jgi:hypothetical protein